MSFDYKPVTLDEYNQSLRDSVNAYYAHASNDPSMSREDVLVSTGAMAESYFGAVAEFQAEQDAQTQGVQETNDVGAGVTDETSEEGPGIDGGEDCDDGMDP